ncbi:Glycosylphosphatidylinositol anchor attachment 1 [Carabus blaptoides fortunei]
METYKDSIPYPWLLAKFRQIGLDTYSHNFTLNYPLGKPQKFTGKNVYGILRAPRASSTESVVLSVPYRPSSSMNPTTAPSVAIMLAFAKFANRERYWAKDIIFLITEHEQLGIQAWLEAYHSTSCGTKGTLQHGDLRGRAGAIQAAINLELHDINIGRIDVKIEGLNGHLPNLDLVTLVNRMCVKEGVQNTFKNRGAFRSHDPYLEWKYSFQTMMSMIATQSTGVPNGNHGLFHRFGIEALTMEGFAKQKDRGNAADFMGMGRILESLFRSLNNLLERFHQSYFFYLLPSSDRFVSIGLYIPVVMCLAGTLFIKPCAHWYKLNEQKTKSRKTSEDDETERDENESEEDVDDIDFVRVGLILLITHAIGISVMNSPKYLTKLGLHYGYATDVSVYFSFLAICALLLFMPLIISGSNSRKNMQVLNIVANLEMGTTLIAIGMMNFSLALFTGTVYVPVVLIIAPVKSRIRSFVQRLLWLVLHPLVVMTTVVMVYTYTMFPNETAVALFQRGLGASQQALMFSIVDSLIYGNWLYKVATGIFLSNWLCLWLVLFPNNVSTNNSTSVKQKLH